MIWVNLYRVIQCRGGSEEGGWTYDQGEPVDSIFCATGIEARLAASRLSDRAKALDAANGPGEYAWHSVRTQTSPPMPYPSTRPSYQ